MKDKLKNTQKTKVASVVRKVIQKENENAEPVVNEIEEEQGKFTEEVLGSFDQFKAKHVLEVRLVKNSDGSTDRVCKLSWYPSQKNVGVRPVNSELSYAEVREKATL